jgi:hypothetical protein
MIVTGVIVRRLYSWDGQRHCVEDRRVPAFGNFNSHRILRAAVRVILLQFLAQSPRRHPDDWINPRIVGCVALEHIHGHTVFLELSALAGQGVVNYVAQETLQKM